MRTSGPKGKEKRKREKSKIKLLNFNNASGR
jgi:hypothetical protein